MGQSSSFYEIKKSDFDRIKNDTSLFKLSEYESMETLEQNAFGIEFIVKKILNYKSDNLVEQIFYPKNYLGQKPDYENIDFAEFDFSEIKDNSISYLTPVKISELKNLIDSINKDDIYKNYNSSELNSNGVYPEVWHDDESNDQAFNNGHIWEGIEQLKSIFSQANKNENYIFVFSG